MSIWPLLIVFCLLIAKLFHNTGRKDETDNSHRKNQNKLRKVFKKVKKRVETHKRSVALFNKQRPLFFDYFFVKIDKVGQVIASLFLQALSILVELSQCVNSIGHML